MARGDRLQDSYCFGPGPCPHDKCNEPPEDEEEDNDNSED